MIRINDESNASMKKNLEVRKNLTTRGVTIVNLLTFLSLAITVFGLNTLVFLYEQTLKDKADDVVEKTMPLLLSLAVSSGTFSLLLKFFEVNLVAYPLHLVSNIQCIQGTKSVLNAHPELTWLNILSKLYSAKARITICQSVNQQFSFRITAEEAASSSPEKFALSNLRSQLFEPRFLLFNLLFRLIIFA